LRVVFAGTPPFAARALAALLDAGHEIPLVLTQPDRPAGRGMKLAASAVGSWAAEHALAIAKPPSLKPEEASAPIAAARPDVMVVAAYGLILPPRVLAIPRHGCINVHASLLPRWRGAAPIQRALLAGDRETGISIMRMDAGLDTGPVLLEKRTPILDEDTAGSLTERLAALGAEAIVEALRSLETLRASPQASEGAKYAPKILKAEARIDWNRTAKEIERQVRAFDPAPGAESFLAGQILKIWRVRAVPGGGPPGHLLQFRDGKLVVACGKEALELLEIQRPGGRRMAAAEFVRGASLAEGARLGQEPLASP
jgi:methionyl-tRNA formyltransferase